METTPLLQANGISKIYSRGALAVGLHRFSASFYKGEFVAVTGSSGSGKSTLLNLLSGLDNYDEGELYFNGEPTSHYNEEDRAKYRKDQVAFVFQDYNIIDSFTVYQNIELALLYSFPDKRARRQRIAQLIDAVGLKGHENQRCSKMSGGQKQRVSIARALAKDAPILFADEPCGNLDSAMTAEIMRLLYEVSKEKLVIIVTHSFDEVAPYATRKIRLADGELVEDQVFRQVAMTAQTVTSATVSRRQAVGLLSHVAFVNIKATPKRSFFGIFSLVVMTALFIVQMFLSVEMLNTSMFHLKYGDIQYRYDLTVMQWSIVDDIAANSVFTQQQLDELNAIDGVQMVVCDREKLNYLVSYSLYDNYFNGYLRPMCNFTDTLYAGRLPQNGTEVVVGLPASRKIVNANILGHTFHISMPNQTITATIVGYTLNEDECVYIGNEFFSSAVEQPTTVVLVCNSEASLAKARSAVAQKGYTVYRLYGDSAYQTTDMLFNVLRAIVLMCIMMLAYRVVTGSYRALEASKQKDYNIMRTVGLPNTFIKATYYMEMVLQAVIGWCGGLLLTVIIALIYGFAVTPDAKILGNLLADNIGRIILIVVLSFVVDILVTLGNAVRFNRYFYQKTVKASLQEDANHD